MRKIIAVLLALYASTSLFAADETREGDLRYPTVARNQRRQTVRRTTPPVAVDCAYDENGDPIPCNDDWGTEPFTGADQTKYDSLCGPESKGTRYHDTTCRTPTTGTPSQYCAEVQGRICEIFQRDNGLGACKTCSQ